jgi:hypothetical protein
MKAVRTCETSFNVNETTRRCIPEDCHLHTRCRENLKSHASREVYHKQAVLISSFLHDICQSWCLWSGFKHEQSNQDRKVQYLVQNEPTIMAKDMQSSEFHLPQQITSQCPNDTNTLRLDNFTVCVNSCYFIDLPHCLLFSDAYNITSKMKSRRMQCIGHVTSSHMTYMEWQKTHAHQVAK